MTKSSDAGVARVMSASLRGLDAVAVRVEVDLAPDLPAFSLVGLPSTGVREARERIGAALRHAGFRWPNGRVTVNLAPTEERKEGAALDLAIATGILLASGQLRHPGGDWMRETLFAAELALDGVIRAPRGLVALAMDAAALGLRRMVVPRSQAGMLRSLTGVETLGLPHLRQLAALLGRRGSTAAAELFDQPSAASDSILRQLRGQERALRAISVAAAGGHHVSLLGPPGCGKTLLARALWSLLPVLDDEAWRARLRIESCCGLPFDPVAARRPPFRAPHHSVSTGGLVGGGRPLAAGEITLAHGGVLFLDEFTEFAQRQLDMLREPMETGSIRLARQGQSLSFPSAFQLVAAANPCPCGYANSRVRNCVCTPGSKRRYLNRLSGPLRDRLELWVELDRVPAQVLLGSQPSVDVLQLRRSVEAAVARGARRREDAVSLSAATERYLVAAADKLQLSARAVHSVLRVARTIALLEGSEAPAPEHLAEACAYRPPPMGIGD
ncbi:MAG TPA: YifB family Mg chelatase-like AAA ATPase [Candidatus Krumholzibacteria bacterium]|jgi:magnesium chelatase family protein